MKTQFAIFYTEARENFTALAMELKSIKWGGGQYVGKTYLKKKTFVMNMFIFCLKKSI